MTITLENIRKVGNRLQQVVPAKDKSSTKSSKTNARFFIVACIDKFVVLSRGMQFFYS